MIITKPAHGAKRIFACKACEDTGHLVAETCRCTGETSLEQHIRTCVIPCVCDTGRKLGENVEVNS